MVDVERRRWTRDELLLALHLYWRIPFGQQHKGNRQVIELAAVLDRTPSSVAMKLSNLTSLDAAELARGVKGLPGASALDAAVWQEFQTNYDVVAPESEGLWRVRVEGL
nr:HNH endonuclease [Deltaproteobacteria bacterium]